MMTPDSDSPHHGRNQAIALLGIGTALIGFGLFTVEARGLAETIALQGLWHGLLRFAVSCFFALLAVLSYLGQVDSVHALLRRDKVSGKDVAGGPMRYLLYLAATVMVSYLFNLQ